MLILTLAMVNMGGQEQLNCMGTFVPVNTEGMVFSFPGTPNLWKSDHSQPHSAVDLVSFPALPEAHAPPMGTMLGSAPSNSIQHMAPNFPASVKDSAVDGRLGAIMQHVRNLGFDNFDELAATYYSSTFKETSALANEQHMSRNSRLPKLISDVFQSANNWSHWERHCFHQEILKKAEVVLNIEALETCNSLAAQVGSLVESPDGMTADNMPEVIESLKRTIQHEVSIII